ncbi:MAG: hypothetical protein M0R22_00375 [Dehalococcoidia bacterium]|jgi:hypothetical protein|nr:hypothetical protein [Dehalococcoidia bacterium]
MPELEIKVDITIKCERCDAELSTEFDSRRALLKVEPCETCLKEEYEEGLADGGED